MANLLLIFIQFFIFREESMTIDQDICDETIEKIM